MGVTFKPIINRLVSFITTRLLIIVGPIALLFNLIPAFKNQFGRWFQAFVNGYATMVVIVVLDAVVNAISESVNSLWDGGQQADVWALILFNLVVIALYIKATSFASHIMGETNLGSSVNQGMAAAIGVASTLTSGAYSSIAERLGGGGGKGSDGEGSEGIADAAESLLGGAK